MGRHGFTHLVVNHRAHQLACTPMPVKACGFTLRDICGKGFGRTRRHSAALSVALCEFVWLKKNQLIFLAFFRPTMPQLCPNYTPIIPAIFHSIFRSTMPQLCPKYAPTLPQLCPARLCPNYAFCPNYAPSFAQTMPQLCFGRLPICRKILPPNVLPASILSPIPNVLTPVLILRDQIQF